jgi:predicted transcriptional regulator of viral defense system
LSRGYAQIQAARGFYTIKMEDLDIEKVAAQLYYPSYISFESALSKYGMINQGLYGLTLATPRHFKKMALAGVDCAYSQLNAKLFFGYDLVNDTFLAQPEKAFLDQVYLMRLGKRSGNTSEWAVDVLGKDKPVKYSALYTPGVRKLISRMGL